MKATAKMITKLVEMGLANEWHKGDMNRLYIDTAKVDEAYEALDDGSKRHVRLPLNRRERQNGKIWIDMETLDLCTKNIDLHMGDEECIFEMLEDLTAEPEGETITAEAEENTVAVEATETASKKEGANTMKKYNVTLSNESCVFDTEEGFETAEKAIEWASGRGGNYIAYFDAGNAEEGKAVKVTMWNNGAYSIYNGFEDRNYGSDALAKYLQKML